MKCPKCDEPMITAHGWAGGFEADREPFEAGVEVDGVEICYDGFPVNIEWCPGCGHVPYCVSDDVPGVEAFAAKRRGAAAPRGSMPNKTILHCTCGGSLEMVTSGYDEEVEKAIAIWRKVHSGPGHGETNEATARRAQQALEAGAQAKEE